MGMHLRVLCEAWILMAPQPQTMGVILNTSFVGVSMLEVFSVKITLCSVSSSAPPKMMSKCSQRVGAEFSVSLQAAGTMRWSMGWGYITHLPAPGTAGTARGLPEGMWALLALCWGHHCPFPTPDPLVVTAHQTARCCLACISLQLPAVALGPGCPQGMHSIRQTALSTAGGQPAPGTGTGALSVGRGRC